MLGHSKIHKGAGFSTENVHSFGRDTWELSTGQAEQLCDVLVGHLL